MYDAEAGPAAARHLLVSSVVASLLLQACMQGLCNQCQTLQLVMLCSAALLDPLAPELGAMRRGFFRPADGCPALHALLEAHGAPALLAAFPADGGLRASHFHVDGPEPEAGYLRTYISTTSTERLVQLARFALAHAGDGPFCNPMRCFLLRLEVLRPMCC